jgi:hypothetical protein
MNIFSSTPASSERKKGFFINLPPRVLLGMIPVPVESERGAGNSVGGGAPLTPAYTTNVDRARFFVLEDSKLIEIHVAPLTEHIKRLLHTTTRIARGSPGSHAYEKMMGIEAYVSANACTDNVSVAWDVTRADGHAFDFVTCSPVQEAHLLLWTLGCETLRRAAEEFDRIGNDVSGDGTTTLDGFMRAAMCFEWLAYIAPQQMQKEYSHAGPLHLQLQVCKAMELLTLACANICRAEEARSGGAAVVVAHLMHAHQNLKDARMRASNPTGVHGMGDAVVDMLETMLEYVATWRRAYNALSYLARVPAEVTPEIEYTTINELNDAQAAFGALRAPLGKGAQTECLELLALVEERAKAAFATPLLRSMNYYWSEVTGKRKPLPLPRLEMEAKEHDRIVLFRELMEK